MAPQSRGRLNSTPLHPFNLGQLPTFDAQTLQPHRSETLSIAASSTTDNDDQFDSEYTLETPSSPDPSSSESDEPDSSGQSPFLRHSNSSFLMANAFAPPYYNRPPTPLPASPSLTSLLRPSFSTTTSRPTTPDSSENDTEAAVAKSARIATTVPRASPKVPTYEYYGFVLYLTSSLAFRKYNKCLVLACLLMSVVMYLLWSYLPYPFLHQLGIRYYPNRWWSLAIPSFLVMTIIYIYVALASYNTGYLTLPMSSIENIVDEAAHVAVLNAKGRVHKKGGDAGLSVVGVKDAEEVNWKTLWNEGTDAVMDVPVGGVCEVLYG